MIYIMKNGGHDTYNIKQFTLDTPDDLPNLPTSGIAVGSAALVISTSDVYMLNSKGEWDLIASDTEGILPPYSAEDIGKILEVGDGGVLTWAANEALPSVTSEDEGKVLKVDDQGEWVAATDSNTQYTAGANISIDENNEISAVDTKYTAGSGIEISEQNIISNTAKGNTDIIAEEYNPFSSYNIGDYCIYNNKLYKCNTVISGAKWYETPCHTNNDPDNGSWKFRESFTTSDENTSKTYVTLVRDSASSSHAIIASFDENQKATVMHLIARPDTDNWQNNGNDNYNLSNNYVGTLNNGYYALPTSFGYLFTIDGNYYADNNSAFSDLFERSSEIDLSKWEEVTVGDELKNIKEDIPTYTAGSNIQISNENVISATDTTYTAGNGITISGQNEISADSQLPAVTSEDEGKILAVNDQGTWTAQEQETIITKSVSGDLVSFSDSADAPLVDCKVQIEAVQSGSGDPSPTNVRPITGWTGANIYTRGFNLWDEEWEVGTISNTDGTNMVNANMYRSKNYISVKNRNIYFYMGTSYTIGLRFYDKDKTFISAQAITQSQILEYGTAKLPSGTAYIRFVNTSTNSYNNNICINVSSSENGTYKPYDSNSETINIDWEDEAGTVYGGTLDVKTGVLTVDAIKISLDNTFDWIQSQGYITSAIISNMKIVDKYRGVCNWLKVLTNIGNGIMIGSNSRRLYVSNEVLTGLGLADIDDWKTYLGNHPLEVTIPLSEPVTYQLTPTTIRSLLGQNNIWADCGAIDLTYFVQGTQPIIDYIDNSKELPAVSSSDEGKVLTVDSSGNWVASTIPDGTDTNY